MRFQNWPELLNNLINDAQFKPFVWGKHDCCLFAANAILAITGIDYAEDLRGKYSTALEASRVLKERGGVRGVAKTALGFEISSTKAQRGDIVLIKTPEHGDTLAVCIGTQCVAPGFEALQRLDMRFAVCAWRVK